MAASAAALQQGDTPRSWRDLPLDLAAAVLRRLPPRPIDRVRFGAVCPQWRAAARESPAMPPHFPWLALPNRTFYTLPDSAFRPLPVHLDGHRQLPHAQTACGEWLVFERQDGAITLMSPFPGATVVLPGVHTLDPRRNDEPFKIVYDVQGPEIRKLVVCSESRITITSSTSSWRCAGQGQPRGRGRSIVDGASVVSRDIVLYQGQLYASGYDMSLSAVSITADDDEPTVSSVNRVIASLREPRKAWYLLESGGALLMIAEYNVPTSAGVHPMSASATRFSVYVANFELSRWTMARRGILEAVLHDRVLFLGPWCSRSVAVDDQRGSVVEGGSVVFFTYECLYVARFHRKRLPFCCGVFSLRTRRPQQSLLQLSVQPLKGFRATRLFPPTQPA